MSAPVDVLAVMIDGAKVCDWAVGQHATADALREARAAVAELIDAAKEVEPRDCYHGDDDEVGTFGCCGEVTYRSHAPDCWLTRLRAAVARVRGEA